MKNCESTVVITSELKCFEEKARSRAAKSIKECVIINKSGRERAWEAGSQQAEAVKGERQAPADGNWMCPRVGECHRTEEPSPGIRKHSCH